MASVNPPPLNFEALEAAWKQQKKRRTGRIHLLVARLGGGLHRTMEHAELCPTRGLIGDRWERGRKPSLGRQLTLMDHRVAKLVGSGRDRQLSGDNVLVDLNLSEDELTVGGGLILGEVRLRLTDEPHLGCKIFAQRFGPEALKWVNWQAHRSRRLRGVNCQVLVGGVIKVGDRLVVER